MVVSHCHEEAQRLPETTLLSKSNLQIGRHSCTQGEMIDSLTGRLQVVGTLPEMALGNVELAIL